MDVGWLAVLAEPGWAGWAGWDGWGGPAGLAWRAGWADWLAVWLGACARKDLNNKSFRDLTAYLFISLSP